MPSTLIRTLLAGAVVATTTVALLPSGAATAAPATSAVVQISSDTFTDTDAQHATEVEPDTFAAGNTIVSAFQIGRIFTGGASDLGWATSTDGGITWHHGNLRGLTVNDGGTFAAVSDPTVAFDARDHTWLIEGLIVDASDNTVGVAVNRSFDGGRTWQSASQAVGFDGKSYDKPWIVCDDSVVSPHFGNCYLEVDVTSNDDSVIMATSTDGGRTWGPQRQPADAPTGLGGQPLVQPDGTVVVPYGNDFGTQVRAFSSTDGGHSWAASVLVSTITAHFANGGLRDGEGLPSAEIDRSGRIYVAWQDCRFRSGCTANDILLSTSANGTTWSAARRVPIDPVTSTDDHFIPGLGVDHATAGPTTKLGLYYYFYPQANCTAATCQMEIGYISSANGGVSWSAPTTVAGPFSLSRIAATNQGPMVGDYISCSILHGSGFGVVAIGRTPADGKAFNEGMYVVPGGIPVTGGANR
jgi:hypothetical protein